MRISDWSSDVCSSDLGARGEHAVGLDRALGDQVVDQHADVGLVAARRPRLFLLHEARGVDTRDQPLRRGFLVAGGAVDLAGEEQAGDGAGFQRVLQSPRVEEVVLDRVAGAGDVRVLEARSEEHTSELQSLMRISYAVFCLKK